MDSNAAIRGVVMSFDFGDGTVFRDERANFAGLEAGGLVLSLIHI